MQFPLTPSERHFNFALRLSMLPPAPVSRGKGGFGFGEGVVTPSPKLETSLVFGFAPSPLPVENAQEEQMSNMIKKRDVGAQTQKKWRPEGPPPEGWRPEGWWPEGSGAQRGGP